MIMYHLGPQLGVWIMQVSTFSSVLINRFHCIHITIILYIRTCTCTYIYMYVYIKLYVSLNGSKLFGHSLFSPLGVGKENCLV